MTILNEWSILDASTNMKGNFIPIKMFNFYDSFGFLINKISIIYRTALYRTFKENNHDITPEQWAILNVLSKNDGLSQTEIAEITSKDKTLITRMLDALEKKKFIERRNDKNDRRYYRIFLTESGKEVLPVLNNFAQKNLEKSIGNIDKKKITIVEDVLKQIEENLL